MPFKTRFHEIEPTMAVDTSTLQNGVHTSGARWVVNGGTFTPTDRNGGICATLASFWCGKLMEGVRITALDQFPSKFALAIAQSAYGVNYNASKDVDLLDQFGATARGLLSKRKKWHMWKKTQLKKATAEARDNPGVYLLIFRGKGGAHATALMTSGPAQFFDPNFGILDFGSQADMKRWVPLFVANTYPDIVADIDLYAVG